MASKKYTQGKNYFKQLVALRERCCTKLTGVRVTAILVTDKGIFEGVNYENIICSLSMCAERTAVYAGITKGMKKIYEVHLLPAIPGMTMCGSCRQLVYGFGGDEIKIYTYNSQNGTRTVCKLGQLMPKATLIAKI